MTARAVFLPVAIVTLVFASLCTADPLGTVNQAGTTWYDNQRLGSAGRSISVDETGAVHLLWTNGFNATNFNRHVYYNIYDPVAQSFLFDGGMQVDAGASADAVTQAVSPDGRSYPLFNGPETALAAIDLLPQAGSYSCSALCIPGTEEHLYYPKVAMDSEGKLHVLAVGDESNGFFNSPVALYYLRGTPVVDENNYGISITWDDLGGSCAILLDSLLVPGYEIVVSSAGDRIAAVWIHSRLEQLSALPSRDNDVYYATSGNGGATWSDPVNVTDFAVPDWECPSGDYRICNRDTFRVFADVSALFDNGGNLHIAFTTSQFYALEDTTAPFAAQIWHWDESNRLYTPIRAIDESYANESWAGQLSDWEAVLQRPSLSLDPVSGDLFCAYTLCPLDQWSALGIPQADIWIARSTDGGLHWSTGVNVTTTYGGQSAPSGQSRHERDLCLADRVAYHNGDGVLNLLYVLDRDAGTSVSEHPTGPATQNTVLLQEISINEIPAQPLVDWCWPELRVDGSGSPCTERIRDIQPDWVHEFALHQNYPNPFNPTTTISFDLMQPSHVRLTVFDVNGREIESFHSDRLYPAGTRTVTFDGADLPSGVYFYRLTAGGVSQSRKMILLK